MEASGYAKIKNIIINEKTFKDVKNGYCFYDDRYPWWKGHTVNKLEELQKFFPEWLKITGAKGLIQVRDGRLIVKGNLYVEYDETKHEVEYETINN